MILPPSQRYCPIHDFSRPIYIVQLLLGRVQTLACAVVERQWTSNVVREKALSSHLLLAHVGKFVIVSAAVFHDLDKALLARQEHNSSTCRGPLH
jgi:hypothetical protein